MARGPPILRRWRVCINGEEHEIRAVAEALRAKVVGDDALRYLVFQLERAPTTGRLHIQAYVEFSVAKRATAVKSFFGGVADVRKCDASRKENIDYASKEDTREEGPWHIGEAPNQGARTDLDEVRTMVEEGSTDLELFQEHFSTLVRYHQGIAKYRNLYTAYKSGCSPIDVRVFWGRTGTGKTRRAVWEAERSGDRYYIVDTPDRPGAAKWFDGYDGTSGLIIDDYGGEYGIHWFKRFLDRYPMQLPVKGGYIPRRCSRVWITSNRCPRDWYPEAVSADLDAVLRRFTSVVHMDMPWTPEFEEQGGAQYAFLADEALFE